MRHQSGRRRAGLCAALLLLLPGAGLAAENPAALGPALDFRFEDINPRSESYGRELALHELYGERGVVLQFVASWCGPCREELPHLQELYESGRAPIVMVAADEHGFPESILIVARRHELTAPILYVPLDQAERLARFYDYQVLPATYLIDRRGLIRQVHQGAWPAERLDAAIERELDID